MASSDFKTNEEAMSDTYGVFSAIEHRPVIRELAKSREDAEALMRKVRAQDAASERGEEEEYYVVRLTKGELEAYRGGGTIPFGT